MTPSLRLALVVHNHQPIGNFDGVVEEAYRDSYLPLLEALAKRRSLRLTLHLSGSLYDWLEERHPEYLEQVAALHRRGRLQILGGGYYEPILPMLPRRDRLAQIRLFSEKLAARFGAPPRGMWLAERVWEQQLAGDLAAAGIQHTVVDDYHFRNAGLVPEQLRGYYLTEDEGRLVALFPGNERLRYLIPFAPPEEAIDYLRSVAEAQPGATLVFADDGEKFGSWPGMREHCHTHGWLDRFFTLLENEPWIQTTTLEETCATVEPLGKIYLPDSSYREMGQWSSLAGSTAVAARGNHVEADARDANAHEGELRRTPGTWRNFLVKYPEAGEMHARMLMVSDRVERAAAAGYPEPIITAARRELYRAQCNCAYWHGTFGGVYYSHLRQAIFRHLIRADDILDRTADRPEAWAEVSVRDHNLDAKPEVCLAGDQLVGFFAPHAGGSLYELDLRHAARNVLAVLARRHESFHEGDAAVSPDVAARRSFVEHFYDQPPALADVAAGRAQDLGDFATGRFQFQVQQTPTAARVRMQREAAVAGHPVKLTKTFTLAAGSHEIVCEYLLENLPAYRNWHFAVELNLAGFAGAGRGYIQQPRQSDRTEGRRLGGLATPLEFPNLQACELVDEGLGVRIGFQASRAAALAIFPVAAVHRSQVGLEATQQAVCAVAQWLVKADAQGRWGLTLSLPVHAVPERRLRDDAGLPLRPDLGDVAPQLEFPTARVITETQTVRGEPEVRRRTTRRLKKAG